MSASLFMGRWTDVMVVLQTTNILIERLRALKHMCGYLENYVDATAKVQKSHSKDYEKILKVGVWFRFLAGFGYGLVLMCGAVDCECTVEGGTSFQSECRWYC